VRRAAALAALIVLAGCGGGDAASTDSSQIDLTVTLEPNGDAGDTVSWQLRCEPTGGDHPDREAACAALTSVDDPFGPVAPPARCEEIPGSDEAVALVEGRFRGRRVSERFSRESACVSGRWDRIAPVFPTGF
jgi:hypothetical protein